MGLLEVKKDFTPRELLWFGPLFALFAGLIGMIILRRFEAPRVAYGIWSVAAAIIVLYYAIPPIRKPLYLGWIYSAFPIGWVISHVLLIAIYYLLITPIGILMKLVGYDPMTRTFDKNESSYWVKRDPNLEKSRYFKQY